MRPTYDAAAIRAAELPLLDALPAGALMQRAAAALAARCAELLGGTYGKRVVLLIGNGDNGGDAMYAGARLARRGARVDALLVGDRLREDARDDLARAGGRFTAAGGAGDSEVLAAADLVVDGMVGIGATGALREQAAKMASLLENCDALVVAVDVPSGVDASTGEVPGAAVRADVTVTFGAAKTGLFVAPGATYAGFVDAVDIGLALPAATVGALDADDVAALLPRPAPDSDKYSRGVVGIVAGSDRYTGAAVLSVGGALRAGAGMVRYAGAAHPAELVRARWPEAVIGPGRVQAWVVGSGLGTDDAAAATVREVLTQDVPVVVDADGLAPLSAAPHLSRDRKAATVLTPHAGELARLLDLDRSEVEARRLDVAKQAAERFGAVVLLKGSTTVVAAPDGSVRINTAQTPYLSTAGSGDVLGGVCGTLLAAGIDARDAAAAAAFLHGLAGVVAAGQPAAPITALDVALALPEAMRVVMKDSTG